MGVLVIEFPFVFGGPHVSLLVRGGLTQGDLKNEDLTQGGLTLGRPMQEKGREGRVEKKRKEGKKC